MCKLRSKVDKQSNRGKAVKGREKEWEKGLSTRTARAQAGREKKGWSGECDVMLLYGVSCKLLLVPPGNL